MGRFLEAVASHKLLNHSWRYLKKEKGLWERNLSVTDMQRDLILHIGQLAQDIANDSYRPAPLRCFEIDKADGKKRIVCAAMVRDKLVQRSALTLLEPLGEQLFHNHSFGFRVNYSVDMAINKVREYVREGYCWLGDADIKSCFDRIPHLPVLQKIQALCHDKEFTTLITYWLTNIPPEFQVGGPGRGLPQGMVLSPFLCNLHLHDMDMLFQRKNIKFVRFADDFVLLCKTEEQAKKALALADEILKKLGLQLHPNKTRVIKSSKNYQFLGRKLPNSKPRFNPLLKVNSP